MGSCERDGDGDGEAPWTPDPQLCESPEALSVFERRIAPLLADDNPSTCNQCHLAGVDLGLFAQADECQTMACMVDEGIVDLDSPDDSLVLSWIERATPESSLITASVIEDERSGVLEWIRYHASCPEACPEFESPCGAGPLAGECEIPASGHDLPARPFDDPGDCSDRTLELAFAEQVYSWRGRCYPCHFSDQDGGPEDAPRWIVAGDCNAASLATMRKVIDDGLIDVDSPQQSLLLLKPLAEDAGGVEHGGSDKFLDTNDSAYRDYLAWIERYARCTTDAR